MSNAAQSGTLEGMSTEEIWTKRVNIPPVSNTEVHVPDSDDEDSKKDLLYRRRLFLKKARAVASKRRTRGRMLLEACERPGSSHLHVDDLLKLAEANVPIRAPVIPSPPDKVFVPESPLSSQGNGY